jgi:hypothetical protein
MNINLKLFMICGCYGRLKLSLDHNIDNLEAEESFCFLRSFPY